MNRPHLKIRDITLISLFTALTIVSGIFNLPLPAPFPAVSLQFFFALCGGMLLGSVRGSLAQFIYIALGLLGLPVFTKGGGIAYVLQPTFGFILGFLFCAFVCGLLAKKVLQTPFIRRAVKILLLFLCAIAGMLICHLCGVTYMYFILNFALNKALSFDYVVSVASLPFLIKDTVLCALAALICYRVRKLIG